MKVLQPGHRYQLQNFAQSFNQELWFVCKEEKDGEFVTVSDGTTNEEVLAVLIDRLTFLDNKLADPMNKVAIDLLNGALQALNARTAARKERGVEGTPAK